MLLAGVELHELIDNNIITGRHENVNSASIDITLGNKFLVETDTIENMVPVYNEMTLQPNGFCLASSQEVFNLPNNISAEYKLKSSMARVGLDHLNAGWCDAGWHGSVLTLEFKNCSSKPIKLTTGMKCGQIIFFKHTPVPKEQSYATKGRYNNTAEVTTVRHNHKD